MLQEMQAMLDTCGVCKRPDLVTKIPSEEERLVRVNLTKIRPNAQVKSRLQRDPCPPGLNACHPKGTCTPNVLASGNYCKVSLLLRKCVTHIVYLINPW